MSDRRAPSAGVIYVADTCRGCGRPTEEAAL